MKRILMIMLMMLASAGFAAEYYFLQSRDGTNFYVKSSNPWEVSDRVARLESSQVKISTETNVMVAAKPNWALQAESIYTNCLMKIGFDGAWTNMNITFQDVGMALLMGVAQTNDAELSVNSTKMISILNPLYDTLAKYAAAYKIDDMRKYPYGDMYIMSNSTERTYIEYEGKKYYPTKD